MQGWLQLIPVSKGVLGGKRNFGKDIIFNSYSFALQFGFPLLDNDDSATVNSIVHY